MKSTGKNMLSENKAGKFRGSIAVVFLIIILLFVEFAASYGPGPNSKNFSVETRLNITGAAPTVPNVLIGGPITLTAGSETVIYCNATIQDYNGDVDTVNATFFRSSAGEHGAEDNNTRYINTSCQPILGQHDGTFTNYSCAYTLQYYAVNGTWNCTVRVNDSLSLTGTGTNNTILNALYALNVTDVLDYGNLNAGTYSNNMTLNVTNLGNININISVYGYGKTPGDGLSFSCEAGNLSANLQHFSANSTADFVTKQNLSGSPQLVRGIYINKTSNTSFSQNATYWELYVDPAQSAYGKCNGTIVFQAETV